MAGAAFDKLDDFVNEVHPKGISRSALMRDVVMQLISQSANTDARKWMTEFRLQKNLQEFENILGAALLKERLKEYKVEREKKIQENKAKGFTYLNTYV